MGLLIYVIFIAIVSIGVVGFLGFSSNDRTSLNDFERQAEFLTSKNEYEKAISYYDKILLYEPKSSKVLLEKANALVSLNEFEKAIKVFDMVLEFDLDNDFAKKGNELATQKLTESLKSDSTQKDREIIVQPGLLYDSVHTYQKSLEIDPKNMNALVGIASALTALERYDEAIYYYEESLSIDPDHKNAKNGLFSLWIKLGNNEAKLFYFDSAIEYFDKVLEIDPKNFNALLAKASSYAEWGKTNHRHYFTSENIYTQILEYYPNNTQALTGKGDVLSKQLEFEKALLYYERALEIDLDNINAQIGKSFVLKRIN